MKADKKMIQQEISQETGNVVLLRDLSNISQSQKKGKTRNDIDASVKMLMDKINMVSYNGPSAHVWRVVLGIFAWG